MPTVEFFVPGLPVAQPRPKVTTRGGFARAYVPTRHAIHAWRSLVSTVAFDNRVASWPIRKPHAVRVTAEFRKLRPATLIKSIDSWTTKPDRDNLEKALLDALEGIAFESDSQVVGGEITKTYHAEPGVLVRIEWDGLV